MVQKPNRKPKYDAIKMRMDLTFDVPAELAEQIEGKYPMSLDTKTGLVMHIACAVNRIAGRGVSIENPHREEIVQNYHGVYRDLRKYVAPVERKFHMIFSDDEMANIISILMQIQE